MTFDRMPSCFRLSEHVPTVPLFSQLPLDDPDFCAIVEKFVGGLDAKIGEMEEALVAEDQSSLRELAHWLKGAGGTVGYPSLSEVALQLEESIKSDNSVETIRRVKEVRELVSRIELGLVPC